MGEVIGKLLEVLGEFALGAGEAIAGAAAWVWGGLGAILGLVLRPLLAVLNPVLTPVADAVYAVLSPFGATGGLVVISAVFGVLLLIAFKYLSNQKAITRVNNDIKANLLALKLYKDELRVTFFSQGRLFLAILRLQRYMLTPILILLLPMLLVLGQMGLRHQWRPLAPGEQTHLTVTLADGAESDAANPALTLEADDGVNIEAGPVYGGGRAVWRLSSSVVGTHTLRLTRAGEAIEKELVVGDPGARVSPLRTARWTDWLLYPAERGLAADDEVAAVSLEYPPLESRLHGSDWWLLTFFVVSMVFALIFKPVFKVKF